MRRIETARDADDKLLDLRCRESLFERAHLNVIGLVAILRQTRRIGRDERKTRDIALQSNIARGRRKTKIDLPEIYRRDAGIAAVIVERALPQTLLRDEIEIDVGEHELRVIGEARRFGEDRAVLGNSRLAIPGEIGRRFALPGRGIEIGREAAQRLRLDEQLPCFALADRDVACRKIGENRRARQSGK